MRRISLFFGLSLSLVLVFSMPASTNTTRAPSRWSTGGSPSAVTGAGVCLSDIDLAGYDIGNSEVCVHDTAGAGSTIQAGQDAEAFSHTSAAKQTGGPTILMGGIGTTNTRIIAANPVATCTTDTVTLSGCDTAGTAWTETYTADAGGLLGWETVLNDAAHTATHLAATIDAGAIASLYVDASAGGATSDFVGIQPKAGKNGCGLTVATSDAACDTVTNGQGGWLGVPDTVRTSATGYAATKITFYASGETLFAGSLWANGQVLTQGNSAIAAAGDIASGDDYLPNVSAAATDVAPVVTTYTTQSPFTGATDVNTTGGNECHQPAPGKWALTGVTAANLNNDTLTCTMRSQCVAAAPVVITESDHTDIGHFTCDGTDGDCVDSIAASLALAVPPASGLTITHTATTERLVLSVVNGVASYFTCVFSDEAGATLTLTRGTDGAVWLGGRYVYMGTSAQGAKFDTANTDDLVIMTNESGAAITLQAYQYFLNGNNGWLNGAALQFSSGGTIASRAMSTASASGNMSLYSGAHTGNGDYDTGAVSVYSGATTGVNDGDTGDVSLYSGGSVALTTGDIAIYSGTATAGVANAGNIYLAVNGAPSASTTKLTVSGATGLSYPSTYTFTTGDSGADGDHATATLTPTANFILCDCDDDDGCTITMGETGMVSGMRITIVGETAYHCDFADTDGVSNLNAAFAMSDDDSLELQYSVDEWVEVGRTDN